MKEKRMSVGRDEGEDYKLSYYVVKSLTLEKTRVHKRASSYGHKDKLLL